MEQVMRKYQKNLRCGITTGTCAAAAAKAAATRLLLLEDIDQVLVKVKGEVELQVPVFISDRNQENRENERKTEGENKRRFAEYMVIKDSGDDPDVTNHAKVYANIEKLDLPYDAGLETFVDEQFPKLYLCGGVGIGIVTKVGLEQKVGQPAINVVPRSMIFRAVQEVVDQSEYEGYLRITISIPEGVELAQRTFNPKLGIEGGISVLGTTGILEPMSEKAIVDTIETEIRQLSAQGMKHLLVTPGNYGQGYVQNYMGMSLSHSVKCSNYIGDTIDLAISYGMETFVLVGNVGKLVKLAAGIMNTHSRVADGRCEVFATHLALCGGTKEQIQSVMESVTTEDILVKLEEWNLLENVMASICQKIEEVLEHRIAGKMCFGVFIFSEKMGFVGKTKDADEALRRLQ